MLNRSKFLFRSVLKRPLEKVMQWHLRTHMEARAIPPWAKIKVLSSLGSPSQLGNQVSIRLKLFGPLFKTATFQYLDFIPDQGFISSQIKGPVKDWSYKMRLTRQEKYACEIIDDLYFSHSYPRFFKPLIEGILKNRLELIFKYKHEILQSDLELLEKYSFEKPLKILVTGASGLIGGALVQFLEFAGHEVWKLSRHSNSADKQTIVWDLSTPSPSPDLFEGLDAVFHLAGENIAKGWWSKKRKKKIFHSRYEGTKRLVQLLSSLKSPPKTLINASAVGFYGDHKDKIVTEETPPGQKGFLSEVCQYWERAAKELEEKGTRVVCARFGVVLSSGGGALKKMLPIFKWGLGGKIGIGQQYISWITLDDLVGALYHLLFSKEISDAVNCTAPHPVMNQVFSKELSRALNRWPGPPVPAFLIRLLFGQKGEELLLSSIRAEPKKLLSSGYCFQYPCLKQAFDHLLPHY